jgi:hypothetical protein
MVKLRRVTEANLPTSGLVQRCREVIKTELGVMPFPMGEDAVVLKAAYFCFVLGHMEIAFSEDVILDVTDTDITVSINRSCTPNGNFTKVFVEDITPQNPFAKALINVCKHIALEVQKTGSEWCRIGNYKNLVIPSPYIDRLKAFCAVNPDLKVPNVALVQIESLGKTQDYDKALDSMKPEDVLTPAEVNTVNQKLLDLIANIGPTIRAPERPKKEVKPISDKQKKNQLNKLLTLGIGGANDKKPKRDPRLINR